MGRRRAEELAAELEGRVRTAISEAHLPSYITQAMIDRTAKGLANVLRELLKYEPKYRQGQQQHNGPDQDQKNDIEGDDLGWRV